MIGRAIVLVRDDQLSQAIGKYGQNVRLASKLVGWDIEIMTTAELEEQIDRAVTSFMELQGMTEDLAQRLVEQGYLSYDDLSLIRTGTSHGNGWNQRRGRGPDRQSKPTGGSRRPNGWPKNKNY